MLLNESFMQGGKTVSPVYYTGYTQDMKSMDIFLYKRHVIYNFFLLLKAIQILQVLTAK